MAEKKIKYLAPKVEDLTVEGVPTSCEFGRYAGSCAFGNGGTSMVCDPGAGGTGSIE